jgi:NADPH-dependent curcumin reductase CurA
MTAGRQIDRGTASPIGVLGALLHTWYGIGICKPKASETVFVSAATGAVGGWQASSPSCRRRVVGCAGGEKMPWAVREAGYDACFNHRPSAMWRGSTALPAGIVPTSRMSAAGSSMRYSGG